jgi:hypothetical protein
MPGFSSVFSFRRGGQQAATATTPDPPGRIATRGKDAYSPAAIRASGEAREPIEPRVRA